LAALLAADGKRVLVIDADLRRPNQSLYFDETHPEPPGLRQVLRGEEEWTNVTLPITSGVGHYYTLPAGGLAQAELLSGPRMAALLEEAKTRCDFVLIDAPSFPRVSDAMVLSGLVDTVLSVVRLGSTSRKDAFEHLRALAAAGVAQPAVLLNDVGQSSSAPGTSRPRRQPVAVADAEPEPQLQRLPRSRALAWWVAGVLLVVGAAAVAASASPKAAQLIGVAVSFHHSS
jgi:tyrosine-protein kinase Etk/Wzc